MNRKLLRATLVGLVLLVAAGAALPWLLSAVGVKVEVEQAEQTSSGADYRAGACKTPGLGTTVVVDFGSASHRSTLVRCALGFGQGTADTGWRLFAAAGIRAEGTTQYPTGFVCRLAGYPTAANQPCTATPTAAEGTWVYYYSDTAGDKGSEWRFRMQGAAMTHPGCGAWEGWRFVSSTDPASDSQPRIKPEPIVCTY